MEVYALDLNRPVYGVYNVSAKSGMNVDDLFRDVIEALCEFGRRRTVLMQAAGQPSLIDEIEAVYDIRRRVKYNKKRCC